MKDNMKATGARLGSPRSKVKYTTHEAGLINWLYGHGGELALFRERLARETTQTGLGAPSGRRETTYCATMGEYRYTSSTGIECKCQKVAAECSSDQSITVTTSTLFPILPFPVLLSATLKGNISFYN